MVMLQKLCYKSLKSFLKANKINFLLKLSKFYKFNYQYKFKHVATGRVDYKVQQSWSTK